MSLVQPQSKNKSSIDQFSFNIRLTLSITFISFLIAFTLTGIFHYLNEKDRATFNFFAVTLGISITGTSAFHAYRNIKQSLENQALDRKLSSENQLIDRTLLYITRWNDPQYLAIQKTANDIYHELHSKPVNEQAKFLIDYLEQNPDKRKDITNALNFPEEMAIYSQ
ncbi:MAG: hypothetical protein MJA27_14250 [Pseudanabaenales cyanobacterium]|nr:hypothetical protein [Pseudanabaenales cyanobacterium]